MCNIPSDSSLNQNASKVLNKNDRMTNFICSVTASIIWYSQQTVETVLDSKSMKDEIWFCFNKYLVPMGYSWCVLTRPWQWGQPGISLQATTQTSLTHSSNTTLSEWTNQLEYHQVIVAKSFHSKCKHKIFIAVIWLHLPFQKSYKQATPIDLKRTLIHKAEMSLFPTVLFHSFYKTFIIFETKAALSTEQKAVENTNFSTFDVCQISLF